MATPEFNYSPVMGFYNDADDRPLVDYPVDDEIPDGVERVWVDESIVVPVCVINGVPYYDR